MRKVNLQKFPFDQCRVFAEELPFVFHGIRQQEIADLLGVSRTTVQSATRYLAKKR